MNIIIISTFYIIYKYIIGDINGQIYTLASVIQIVALI